MTISQMQNKYDEIANDIKLYDLKLFNLYDLKLFNDNGKHTPSVYQFVKFAITHEYDFLSCLLNDDDIDSEEDLTREQRSDLEDFVKFCDRTDNPREKVITEHGEDIDEVEYFSNCFSYVYKDKDYNITGDFYIDNDGYLHHWHDDDGEEFEIKYLLHEDW